MDLAIYALFTHATRYQLCVLRAKIEYENEFVLQSEAALLSGKGMIIRTCDEIVRDGRARSVLFLYMNKAVLDEALEHLLVDVGQAFDVEAGFTGRMLSEFGK